MEESSVKSVQNQSEDKNPDSIKQRGGRPSFWSYTLSNRGIGAFKDRKTGKYFMVVKRRARIITTSLIGVFAVLVIGFAISIIFWNGENYYYDILLAICIVILILLMVIEFKLAKFRILDKYQLYDVDKHKKGGKGYGFLVIYSIVLIIVAVAFLNSFTLSWLMSLNEEKQQAYLHDIWASGGEFTIDKNLHRFELDEEMFLTDDAYLLLIFRTERSIDDVEISINGNIIDEDDIGVYNLRTVLWDKEYFKKQYRAHFYPENFEEYNTVRITCGEATNEYEVLVVNYLDELLIYDGEFEFGGNKFGDDYKKIVQNEKTDVDYTYVCEENEALNNVVYANRSFMGLPGSITYTFDNDELVKFSFLGKYVYPYFNGTWRIHDIVRARFGQIGLDTSEAVKTELENGYIYEWSGENYYMKLTFNEIEFLFEAEQR